MGMQGFASFAGIGADAGEQGGWRLSADGLEHAATGYFIGRDDLARRRSDGFWLWPAHVLEKSWVEPDGFARAFRLALAVFGIPADIDLDRTFGERDDWLTAADVTVPRPRGSLPGAAPRVGRASAAVQAEGRARAAAKTKAAPPRVAVPAARVAGRAAKTRTAAR